MPEFTDGQRDAAAQQLREAARQIEAGAELISAQVGPGRREDGAVEARVVYRCDSVPRGTQCTLDPTRVAGQECGEE
jgi:hypothetical protein